MKNLVWLFILLFGLSLAACSGGDADKTTDQGNPDSENPSVGETIDAPDINEATKQAQEAMKNLQGGEQVEPVNFRELQNLLPEKLAGMERTNKSGETAGAMGITISRAEGTYKKGNNDVRIEIVDTGGFGMAAMGMAAWATMTVDKEDDHGYERTGMIDGHKSYEKYQKNGSDCQVAVLVAKRFIVTASGRDCDMGDMKDAVKGLDLNKLSALK